MKRRFAKVERFVWDDARFRALSLDARLMWLYLLTTPNASYCPGLVIASEIAIGEHLGWVDPDDIDSIATGVGRVREALGMLAKPSGDSDSGWIGHDRAARVIFIRKAVRHDPPKTVKQVKNWITKYREIPSCALKTEWLHAARDVTASLYGADDPRAAAFCTLVRSVNRQNDDSAEPSERAYKLIDDGPRAVKAVEPTTKKEANSITAPSWGITGPSPVTQIPSPGITTPSEKIHGSLKKTHESLIPAQPVGITEETNSDNIQTCDRMKCKNPKTSAVASFDSISREQVECLQHSEEGGTLPGTPPNDDDQRISGASGAERRTPHPSRGSSSSSKKKKAARKPRKYETEGKPEQPPEGFNARQRAVWEALRTATFYVPGQGLMTAWQAVSDPVLLAAQLGGDAYPAVDVGLVHRLGNWTTQHKQRAKREVGRFLLNRFSTSQERGNALQNRVNTQTHGAPRAGNQPDLEERLARLNSERKGMQ